MSTLKVYCDDLDSNPQCVHGPTLLFSRQVKGKERKFYACSAYRSRKDCPFFLWADEKHLKLSNLKNRHPELISCINHQELYSNFRKFKSLPVKNRKFCHTCFTFVFPSDKLLHANHCITDRVSDISLTHPTLLIQPIQSSKKEAQFWFSESSKKFIVDSLKNIDILSCLCIGAPTIHESLRHTKINSLLLDLDKRYHCFYNEKEFCWFNMFNSYFMSKSEKSQENLKNFLKSSAVAVVIDPPFGARIEPLAYTVNVLQKQATSELNIFLVLPYFMEPNIVKYFSNFEMLDYQVQYSNHRKFQNKLESKKKPSAVRIFTNVSPNFLKMPESEGYYYCLDCKRWRYKNNKHCILCRTCPSKNGDLYKHCYKCCKCVKQTWTHCLKCNRCCIPSHDCSKQHKEYKKRTNDCLQSSNNRKNRKKRKKRSSL